MGTADVYRISESLDDSTLEILATRLESRGKHPRFMAMMNDYLDAMKIETAAAVLDLGCGTGVAARAVARRKGFGGRITGIDVSPYLVVAAKRLAAEEGLAGTIEFRTGDSQRLDLGDASFDAAIAHTLVSHVQDPLAVLRELARIVKPGGTVGIFDGDYASLTFGSDDPDKGRADDEAIIEGIVTNPRVMRQMPQWLRDVGLELTASYSYVLAEIGKADFWASLIQSFPKVLPTAGTMTQTDAQAFVDAMVKRSAQGVFFGASNYYGYVATRR